MITFLICIIVLLLAIMLKLAVIPGVFTPYKFDEE